MFIHDVAYRYQTVHIYVGPVPFLGGDLYKIKRYCCVGVFACPASKEVFRSSTHCEVDPKDKNILKILEDMAPNEIAKKKVLVQHTMLACYYHCFNLLLWVYIQYIRLYL